MSRREFHLREGSSDKFWAITVDGTEFTVEFGRAGTKGQSQTKQFTSEADARAAADKLIAEKTKKGYAEAGAATAASPPESPPKARAKSKKQTDESTTPPPPAPAPLEVRRTIELAPEDWHRATWRPRRRLPVPEDIPCRDLCKDIPRLFREDVSAKELVTILNDQLAELIACMTGWDAVTWAGRHLIPYLSDDVLADLRQHLRSQIDSRNWPTDSYKRPAMPFFLAALSGLHAEVLAVVASWPDDRYGRQEWDDHYHMPQQMIFGLGDPKLVEQHMRRLKLRLKKPEYVRAWLAHTELTALDYVRDSIQKETNKDHARKLFELFALVKAPEAAPYMLELKLSSKVPMLARQWLDENLGSAIAGLIPAAAGRGKLAEVALEFLRDARRQGHEAFIAEQLRSAAPEIANRVRQEVLERVEVIREPLDDATTPPWLKTTLKDSEKASALPGWVQSANLPPLVVGERRLNDNQMSAVLSALRQSPLRQPSPLVQAIKEHIDPASRDAFAWKLFELWLGEGAPSKEKWALLALGHLGGDACTLKLTPLVRAWPGESQHQRAVMGLECLRAIGSDTALMQLNSVAQKLKFQGLKKKAQEFMEAIAKDRNMSRAQLEDRIVPDLDLDERGTRVFDFGPRRFTVVLDADLKPVICDEAGKLKSDLPRPGAKDDETKANAALADWKILKKQLREVVKVQAYRLEQAMITGRRWTVEEFEQLLVRHPLMTNLVRRLVWGGYDKKDELRRTFRVTEEREYADARDDRATLDGLAAVGIVHPLHLSEDDRSAWGQVLGDYEIIAPFPQLGRPVYALEPDEARGSEIKRFGTVKIPAGAYMGTMEKLGWTRGSASDHGVITEFLKPFPAADVTAIVENEDGVMLGLGLDASGDQRITRCFFLNGVYTPMDYPYHKDLPPLKDVAPLAVSEVLADLTTLASKGK
jgi:predicted DNA-binding WGR domain protein